MFKVGSKNNGLPCDNLTGLANLNVFVNTVYIYIIFTIQTI